MRLSIYLLSCLISLPGYSEEAEINALNAYEILFEKSKNGLIEGFSQAYPKDEECLLEIKERWRSVRFRTFYVTKDGEKHEDFKFNANKKAMKEALKSEGNYSQSRTRNFIIESTRTDSISLRKKDDKNYLLVGQGWNSNIGWPSFDLCWFEI